LYLCVDSNFAFQNNKNNNNNNNNNKQKKPRVYENSLPVVEFYEVFSTSKIRCVILLVMYSDPLNVLLVYDRRIATSCSTCIRLRSTKVLKCISSVIKDEGNHLSSPLRYNNIKLKTHSSLAISRLVLRSFANSRGHQQSKYITRTVQWIGTSELHQNCSTANSSSSHTA